MKVTTEEFLEWKRILMETGLFGHDDYGLRLLGTPYLIYPTNKFKYPRNQRPAYNDWRYQVGPWIGRDQKGGSVRRSAPFEEVFDSVPEDIKLKLVYHLDLFT